MKHPFSAEELLTIFEAARIGMSDADNFDRLADTLDLSDYEMCTLREKLHSFMDVG